MVVGAHAVFVYGAARFSGDLDIAIHLPESDRERVRAVLEQAGLTRFQWRVHPEWGRRWWCLDPTGLPVEFFFTGESPVAAREHERRRRAQIGGNQVWVISPEDLVLRKLVNCRLRAAHDYHDVISVLRVQGGNFDRDYVRQHCSVYRICGLFERAAEEAKAQGKRKRS